MPDPAVDAQARAFFEDLWRRGDPWELDTSQFEQTRYERQLALLAPRRFRRALEIGCGAGAFTGRLADLCDDVVAIDVSPAAIDRARATSGSPNVEFQVANVMEYDLAAEGTWDLVVLSETVYYLGWLYSFFDVAWLASQLFASTSPGGTLLLSNAMGWLEEDPLVRPWIIRSYRDLFVNVGYVLETEEVVRGHKHGVELEVLMSLFRRGADA